MKLVFVDTETTGLDITRHEVWEIALTFREEGKEQWTYDAMVRPNLSDADPNALRLSGFYDRYVSGPSLPIDAARYIARFTSGATLVGANPSFDAQFLNKFLRKWNYAPAWNHRMVDVEVLAQAALKLPEPIGLVKSAEALGMTVDLQAAHTALYDAQIAMHIYDTIIGVPPSPGGGSGGDGPEPGTGTGGGGGPGSGG